MKVGILTHYYDSQNFGGNLQAYALCRALNALGADAEHISFPISQKKDSIPVCETSASDEKEPLYKRVLRKNVVKIVKRRLERRLFKQWSRKQERKFNVSERRKAAFENFNKAQIPHSNRVYYSNDIRECVNDYDLFITGSDQVWNLKWYFKAFFLDFVPSDKKKISYAASISLPTLSDDQRLVFKSSLKDFDAISVREKSGIELIKDLSPVPVVETLDPTLLLSKDDWDAVASDRLIDGGYIFCYFIGEDKNSRKLSRKFAKTNKLRLVTVPHAGVRLKYEDKGFGDIQLYDATPNDFISLIKHARYVLTDSFHAVVFSYIYQKQFFVFNRNSNGEMNARITDICELFGTQDRYCPSTDRMNIKYMNSLPPIDYKKENPLFEKQKEKSIGFLKESLQ